MCVKYNYTLNGTSPVGCFDSILQLSSKTEELIITKKVIREEIIDSVKEENKDAFEEELKELHIKQASKFDIIEARRSSIKKPLSSVFHLKNGAGRSSVVLTSFAGIGKTNVHNVSSCRTKRDNLINSNCLSMIQLAKVSEEEGC